MSIHILKGGLDITGLTDYGMQVKMELLKQNVTQVDLEKRITERTGLYVDDSYLRKVLTGKNKAEKIVTAINEILGIKG